jgi:response regulator RpfG family c-di-GMP phosphodiesterase
MSKRILVVEDQPDNRQIIRDMLAPTDYEIMEVESGEDGTTHSGDRRRDRKTKSRRENFVVRRLGGMFVS